MEVIGRGAVSVSRTVPATPSSDVRFVYAPGAGSNLNDPFGVFCARALADAGIETWRLQFPYMQAQRPAPDRTPVLEATWRAVVEAASEPGVRLVAGGRSMGGRIASQVVAQGTLAAGLALFAYPLHPPGRPDNRRDAHVSSIKVPTLFCSRTRDTYATPAELRDAAAMVEQASVHLLEGADHGFAVLKSSGRTREDVYADAVQALLGFLEALPG